MATTYKRRISPVPKGTFSTGTTYAVLDVVKYDGKSYICKTAVTAAGAWDAAKWMEICADGAQGAKGDAGKDGAGITDISAVDANGEITITVG